MTNNKTFILDFNLEAWIKNLPIEASSKEEAKSILLNMSLEEIIENGSGCDANITMLDIMEQVDEVEEEEEEEEDKQSDHWLVYFAHKEHKGIGQIFHVYDIASPIEAIDDALKQINFVLGSAAKEYEVSKVCSDFRGTQPFCKATKKELERKIQRVNSGIDKYFAKGLKLKTKVQELKEEIYGTPEEVMKEVI